MWIRKDSLPCEYPSETYTYMYKGRRIKKISSICIQCGWIISWEKNLFCGKHIMYINIYAYVQIFRRFWGKSSLHSESESFWLNVWKYNNQKKNIIDFILWKFTIFFYSTHHWQIGRYRCIRTTQHYMWQSVSVYMF